MPHMLAAVATGSVPGSLAALAPAAASGPLGRSLCAGALRASAHWWNLPRSSFSQGPPADAAQPNLQLCYPLRRLRLKQALHLVAGPWRSQSQRYKAVTWMTRCLSPFVLHAYSTHVAVDGHGWSAHGHTWQTRRFELNTRVAVAAATASQHLQQSTRGLARPGFAASLLR